ncbi:MAG: DUF4281 domain-containing protein [Acidobacteria bacterium]|nr:DUF4281 domain-containing protein [Acidobacteriota bacterium]
MDLESVFTLCTTAAMAGWLLLIVAPRWPVTRWAAGLLIPVAISAVYLALIAAHMPGARGGFGALAEVTELFSQPPLLLAGWVHYLAFDLFVGAWEARDAQRHAIPHLLLVPCLLMTFMLGPIGLLAYIAIRAATRRVVAIEV